MAHASCWKETSRRDLQTPLSGMRTKTGHLTSGRLTVVRGLNRWTPAKPLAGDAQAGTFTASRGDFT